MNIIKTLLGGPCAGQEHSIFDGRPVISTVKNPDISFERPMGKFDESATYDIYSYGLHRFKTPILHNEFGAYVFRVIPEDEAKKLFMEHMGRQE